MEFEILKLDKLVMNQCVADLLSMDKDISSELGLSYGNEQWTIDNFLKDFAKKWDYSYLVLCDKIVCGFAINSQMIRSQIHIHRFAVAKNFRNLGVGKILIRAIIGVAAENSCVAVTVETSKQNIAARKFYEANGFILLSGLHLREYVKIRKDNSKVKLADNFTCEPDGSEFVILSRSINRL